VHRLENLKAHAMELRMVKGLVGGLVGWRNAGNFRGPTTGDGCPPLASFVFVGWSLRGPTTGAGCLAFASLGFARPPAFAFASRAHYAIFRGFLSRLLDVVVVLVPSAFAFGLRACYAIFRGCLGGFLNVVVVALLCAQSCDLIARRESNIGEHDEQGNEMLEGFHLLVKCNNKHQVWNYDNSML
jgi:hypothetical protein